MPNTNDGTREVGSEHYGQHGNKIRIVLVVAVLVLAVGYLGFTAFPGNALYYFTVTEVLQENSDIDGQNVRIVGKLQPDSFNRTSGTVNANFTLVDEENILNATYSGVLPDLFFNPESEIVVEGQYNKGEIFHTTNVIVKCPSKYSATSEEVA